MEIKIQEKTRKVGVVPFRKTVAAMIFEPVVSKGTKGQAIELVRTQYCENCPLNTAAVCNGLLSDNPEARLSSGDYDHAYFRRSCPIITDQANEISFK